MIRMTKIRTFIGAIFAIALALVFFSIVAALAGLHLPVLSAISDALGFRR